MKVNTRTALIVGGAGILLTALLSLGQELNWNLRTRTYIAIAITLITLVQQLWDHVLSPWRDGRRDRKSVLEQILVSGYPPPRIADADHYQLLGVFPSAIAERYTLQGETRPPYIPRDVDQDLRAALRSAKFVLITGPTKSGKTRTAAEAVSEICHTYRLLVPRRQTDEGPNKPIHQLANLDFFPKELRHDSVLWLDDADYFVRNGDLTYDVICKLQQRFPQLVIVGTMRDKQALPLLEGEDEVARTLVTVMQASWCQELRLEAPLSTRESEAAQTIYSALAADPAFHGGMGEYFIASDALRRRVRLGREAAPGGLALVFAAADWFRAGMRRPVPLDLLEELSRDYVLQLNTGLTLDEAKFHEALYWARQPVASSAALLVAVPGAGQACFTMLDYVVELIGETRPTLPLVAWQAVLRRVTPADAFSVGLAAYLAGNPAEAERAWVIGADSDDEAAPLAALNIGVLHEQAGDMPQAESYFLRAMNTDHSEVRATALLNLGNLYRTTQRSDEARVRLQEAIALNHPNVSPLAAVALGNEVSFADPLSARAAYAFALTSQHPEASPQAAYNLGLLLKNLGDMDGAREMLDLARGSSHRECASKAALNLAVLEEDHDDEAALRLYDSIVESGHPSIRLAALINSADLVRRMGDTRGAISRYEQLLIVGNSLPEDAEVTFAGSDPPLTTEQSIDMVHYNLGNLLLGEGQSIRARELLTKAAESSHDEIASRAGYNLAKLLRAEGEREAAADTLKKVIAVGHPDEAPGAKVELGGLLRDQGQLNDACRLFKEVAELGHPAESPLAELNLGGLLQAQGNLSGAEDHFRIAMASSHPTMAPRAALCLASLLEQMGRKPEAIKIYQETIHAYGSEFGGHAARQLAMLLHESGDKEAAAAAFRKGAELGDLICTMWLGAGGNMTLLTTSDGQLIASNAPDFMIPPWFLDDEDGGV